jgi:hypothetical protein
MTQPVEHFNIKAFRAYQKKNLEGALVQSLGIADISTANGDDTIVIPCFHPGRHGHMGILCEKGQQVFKLVSALAWDAVTEVIRITKNHPHHTRRSLCIEVKKQLSLKVHKSHPFGLALLIAKKEYLDTQKAFQEGALVRRNAPDLAKPSRGLLARKTVLTRKGRNLVLDTAVEGGIGGYEVLLQEQIVLHAPNGDNVRITLSWAEDDGNKWCLGPIILPENSLPSDTDDKRFLYL